MNRASLSFLLLVAGLVSCSGETLTPPTTLSQAVLAEDLEAARRLLAADADPDKRDWAGMTPLLHAACLGNASLTALLLAAGADPNLRDTEGYTPLLWAAEYGTPRYSGPPLPKVTPQHPDYPAVVRALLERGADPNQSDLRNRRPLHLAASGDRADLIRPLVEHGADVNARDSLESTPLYDAGQWTIHDPVETVSLLLELGADPNLTSRFEEPTPLMQAARKGYLRSLEALVSRGAILDASDEGNTAVDYAAWAHQRGAVQLLLRAGAQPTAAALTVIGDTTRLRGMIESNPDLARAKDSDLLYLAVLIASSSVAALLLDYGADVNGRDWCNPLLAAVHAGDASTVALLLSRGARPNVCEPLWCGTGGGTRGSSALEIAEYEDRADIAALLRRAGASSLYFVARDNWPRGLIILLVLSVVGLLTYGTCRAKWRHRVSVWLFRC